MSKRLFVGIDLQDGFQNDVRPKVLEDLSDNSAGTEWNQKVREPAGKQLGASQRMVSNGMPGRA